MIKLHIDVTKIDKEKLFKGEKGTYLDCVLIPTPNSPYSDYMIVQDTTKEEREAGIKGTILGNAKELKKPEPDSIEAAGDAFREGQNDIPF